MACSSNIQPATNKTTSMFEFFNLSKAQTIPESVKKEQVEKDKEDIKKAYIDKTPIYTQNGEYKEGGNFYKGKLVIIDFILYFFPTENSEKKLPYTKEYFIIPVFSIKKIEGIDNFKEIKITTKDYRELTFVTSNFYLHDKLRGLAFPNFLSGYHEFALAYGKESKEIYKIDGWHLFDLSIECLREGITDLYRITDANVNYNLCETYPKYLVIPSGFEEKYLNQCSEFRSLNRFPVLTYFYKYKNSSLWRSSQCLKGLTLKSSEYEKNYFHEMSKETQNLIIYDARPYLNAVANSLKGAGIESKSDYDFCQDIKYCDIENIHNVRSSLKKSLFLFKSYNDSDAKKFYSKFEQAKWLDYISSIIKASVDISDSMKEKRTVLVHCSDGWDRTTQLCSVVQILLDSYFRTLEGFCILIEKEWVSYGHQFAIRCGNDSRKDKRKLMSPIFIQFLDVVYQIMIQFPTAFEFRTNLLTFLSNEIYSCKYGTFLFNSQKEIENSQAKNKMISIWSEILLQRKIYYNPLYLENKYPLVPRSDPPNLKIWVEFFFKYDKGGCEKEVLESCNKHYNALENMIQVLKEQGMFDKLTKDTQTYLKNNF